MANFFDGTTLHELAGIVREVQAGKRPIGPGIDRQLRERCWQLTNGRTRAQYIAELTDAAAQESAFSDWMAVDLYAKTHRPG